MKIYVASSFLNKENARTVMDIFEDEGFEITYDWTKHEPTTDLAVLRSEAIKDLEGVQEADVLILLAPFRFGSAGEATAAMILDKPVIIIGTSLEFLKTTFLFAFHPQAHVTGTAMDAIRMIQRWEDKG